MPELTDEQVWLMNLSYEIRAMAELPTYIKKYHESGPTLVAAACLEATLLHARALIEFVAGRPRRDNRRGRSSRDFDPTCFLPGWQLLEPERFDAYLGLIDAHLAHLSKRRGGGDGVMGPGFVTTWLTRSWWLWRTSSRRWPGPSITPARMLLWKVPVGLARKDRRAIPRAVILRSM